MTVGDIVVHKTMGQVPLTVISVADSGIVVRYGNNTQNGIQFETYEFLPQELETVYESIAREAEIFQTLNAKKAEINGYKPGPVPVN